MCVNVDGFVFEGVLRSNIMDNFPSLNRFSIPSPIDHPTSAYQTDRYIPEPESYTSIALTSRTITSDVMNRTVGPLFSTATTSRHSEVICHRAGRDVDKLSLTQPPMALASYMDLDRRGHETFLDADRWREM